MYIWNINCRMAKKSILGCTVSDTTQSDSVLDPCNCTSYYQLITDPSPKKQILTCPTGELWDYKTNTCESQRSVIKSGTCDRVMPWNRCDEAVSGVLGASFRTDMKNKCIANGRYNEDVADTLQKGLPGAFLEPDQSQSANIELAAAAFVAGCVITLIIVAMVLTICGLPNIRLPKTLAQMMKTKQSSSKKRTKLSKKTTRIDRSQTITEGDNVSVLYEDIDEDEPQTSHTASPKTNVKVQTTRVQVTKTTKTKAAVPTHVSYAQSQKPPSRSPPAPGTKTISSNSPGSPQKPPIRPVPKPNHQQPRVALTPPKKTNATQQPSFGYLHPK